MTTGNVVEYWIDSDDRLVGVNDAWATFATANGSPALGTDTLFRRRLWDFIADPTTRQLYQAMCKRVRAGGPPIRFRFRCDAPERRRLLEMQISRELDSGLRFRVAAVLEQERPSLLVLIANPSNDGALVVVCSWCERIELSRGQWVAVEDAVSALELLHAASPPRLSHGICRSCFEIMTSVVESELLPGDPPVTVGFFEVPSSACQFVA